MAEAFTSPYLFVWRDRRTKGRPEMPATIRLMVHASAAALAVLVLTSSFPLESAAEGEIKMKPAVEIRSRGELLYRVNYQYAFPERSSVFIDGVGTVPASGSLAYLSSTDSIKFLDRIGGQTLAAVAIVDPVRFMGEKGPVLPRESDFPEAYRQGRWSGKQPFANVALGVLDRFFPSGYRAYRRADRQLYLTTYAVVPKVPDRISAEVAVLVSWTADANPFNLPFTVQYSARERRTHSEWRSDLADGTRGAVDAFAADLLKELQRGTRR